MNYIFKFPKEIKVKFNKVISLHGGMCPTRNLIYLFGRSDEYIDAWCDIITHEHLHSELHKIGVPVETHHLIIDRIEKAQELIAREWDSPTCIIDSKKIEEYEHCTCAEDYANIFVGRLKKALGG